MLLRIGKLIVLFLALASSSADGLRILGLFPLQGKSHFDICGKLMKGLAAKGHQVDVYSHFPLKKPIANYNDFSLQGTLPQVLNNMTYDFYKQIEKIDMGVMMNQVGESVCDLMDLPLFQKLFEDLKKKQPYDLVVTEIFVSNCYLAWGRHLGIPMVGVMTSGLLDWFNGALGNPMNTAVTPGLWSGLFYPMDFWERFMNTFIYTVINAQYRYYIRGQNKHIEKFFGPGYPDAAELPKDIDLLLVNSHFVLEGIRAYTPSIVPVAGLHIDDDNSTLAPNVQKWLDDSKDGCIYMSFGSMMRIETFPKNVLDAFYASFKKLAPVRVLMKIAKPEELPPGLPSNVMTQSWFAQLQVLKHKNLKAFVTHGGLMSTLESVYVGVPMIGVPLFGDQMLNVQVQVRRKTATQIKLSEISENAVTTAVREIIQNPVYEKNIKQLSREFLDRPMKAMDLAIYWIEYVVRHGKKSLRSPVVDMPWWQANLIDVYAFILFVLIALYYILKLSFKLIIRLFCGGAAGSAQSKKVKKQ